MKLTKETENAINILKYLSGQNGNLVGSADIVRDLSIQKDFAFRSLRWLREAKFIGGLKGQKGGYFLLKFPREITLSEVFTATKENTSFQFKGMNKVFNDYLKVTTIADLNQQGD